MKINISKYIFILVIVLLVVFAIYILYEQQQNKEIIEPQGLEKWKNNTKDIDLFLKTV